jgi:chitin deacetylase
MMTTLTNEEIVAELGMTMEIIRNSTGGRVPRYWRPPYGDSDNRVNAIANEVCFLTLWDRGCELALIIFRAQVFHLTTIWWNNE